MAHQFTSLFIKCLCIIRSLSKFQRFDIHLICHKSFLIMRKVLPLWQNKLRHEKRKVLDKDIQLDQEPRSVVFFSVLVHCSFVGGPLLDAIKSIKLNLLVHKWVMGLWNNFMIIKHTSSSRRFEYHLSSLPTNEFWVNCLFSHFLNEINL